ncbi:MAG TPA: long-chain fatty acid--CoA ligase [Gemmatimonadota bacterium]|jgi:long-chain acyl-CoA synthetase
MDVCTLPQLLTHAVQNYDRPDALKFKRDGAYVDISTRQLQREVESVGFGLLALGLQPGDRVALLSENRPGWVLADLAILSAAGLTVPIYPTLVGEQVQYILQDSEARICVVSTREQLEKVLAIRGGTRLQHVITLDPLHHDDPSVQSLKQVSALGEKKRDESPALLRERLDALDPHGVATILYTSGTTGRPKGVMLSHENILSNAKSALVPFGLGPSDLALSFLPLSHSFERTCGYYALLHAGVSIAYAESVEAVAQNMLEVRPTIVMSVPRLYEKMYARVMDAALAGSPVKKRLFVWAKDVGERVVDLRLAGKPVGRALAAQHALASRLVFSKLRARTGGRVRIFISGSAPLSPKIARFFWGAGLPIYEGYGLTETSPVVTCNSPQAVRLGTVGKPIPGVEVRIAEDGEILVKGPNVMLGYYRLPEETANAMADGWFRTGDIGHLDKDGFLLITDRKKDLIKTSGGKYIAPQPIETRLKLSKFVSQAVVVGNRRKYACVLLVPNLENLRKHADRTGIPFTDNTGLLGHPQVRRLYEEIVDEVNVGAAHFESVKRFSLLAQDFSIESGELTPTLKVKRSVVENRYAEEIDAMYDERLPV